VKYIGNRDGEGLSVRKGFIPTLVGLFAICNLLLLDNTVVEAQVRQFGFEEVVPGVELRPLGGGPSRPVGLLETFIVELDENEQTVRFQLTLSRYLTDALPNAFAVVMNGGGMPSGNGDAPIVVFDGSDTVPRITVARYIHQTVGTRMLDSLFNPGGEILISGDASLPEVLLAVKEIDGDRVYFELQLDISGFNMPSNSFPQWQGFVSTGEIGIWMDVYQDLNVCYSDQTGSSGATYPFGGGYVTPGSCVCNTNTYPGDPHDDDSSDDCSSDDNSSDDNSSDDYSSDDNSSDDHSSDDDYSGGYSSQGYSSDDYSSDDSSSDDNSSDDYSSDDHSSDDCSSDDDSSEEEEEEEDFCYSRYGRLDIHEWPFDYTPSCSISFLTLSDGLSPSGLDQFLYGTEVEIQGACSMPDGSDSILEFSPLPDGSIASVNSGSSVASDQDFFFGIPTTQALPGDVISIDFSCTGVNAYMTGLNLSGASCEIEFEIYEESFDEPCEEEDNTSILFTLDGLGKDMDTLNRRIARKARKRNPQKRRRIRSLEQQSADAAIDAWGIWIDLPTITYQCDDPTITVLDHSGARFDYIDDINELEVIGKRLSRILKQGGAKRRARKFRRRVKELAETARQEAENTPIQSSGISF